MAFFSTKKHNSENKDTVKEEDYIKALEELYENQKIIESYMEKFGPLNKDKPKKKAKKKK